MAMPQPAPTPGTTYPGNLATSTPTAPQTPQGVTDTEQGRVSVTCSASTSQMIEGSSFSESPISFSFSSGSSASSVQSAATPTPPAIHAVQGTVSLDGVSVRRAFGTAAQTGFKEVIASYLAICGSVAGQCASNDVTILSSSRRAVSVQFRIATTSAAIATAGAATLTTAITTNAATFKADLVAKGGDLANVTSTTTTDAPFATTTSTSGRRAYTPTPSTVTTYSTIDVPAGSGSTCAATQTYCAVSIIVLNGRGASDCNQAANLVDSTAATDAKPNLNTYITVPAGQCVAIGDTTSVRVSVAEAEAFAYKTPEATVATAIYYSATNYCQGAAKTFKNGYGLPSADFGQVSKQRQDFEVCTTPGQSGTCQTAPIWQPGREIRSNTVPAMPTPKPTPPGVDLQQVWTSTGYYTPAPTPTSPTPSYISNPSMPYQTTSTIGNNNNKGYQAANIFNQYVQKPSSATSPAPVTCHVLHSGETASDDVSLQMVVLKSLNNYAVQLYDYTAPVTTFQVMSGSCTKRYKDIITTQYVVDPVYVSSSTSGVTTENPLSITEYKYTYSAANTAYFNKYAYGADLCSATPAKAKWSKTGYGVGCTSDCGTSKIDAKIYQQDDDTLKAVRLAFGPGLYNMMSTDTTSQYRDSIGTVDDDEGNAVLSGTWTTQPGGGISTYSMGYFQEYYPQTLVTPTTPSPTYAGVQSLAWVKGNNAYAQDTYGKLATKGLGCAPQFLSDSVTNPSELCTACQLPSTLWGAPLSPTPVALEPTPTPKSLGGSTYTPVPTTAYYGPPITPVSAFETKCASTPTPTVANNGYIPNCGCGNAANAMAVKTSADLCLVPPMTPSPTTATTATTASATAGVSAGLPICSYRGYNGARTQGSTTSTITAPLKVQSFLLNQALSATQILQDGSVDYVQVVYVAAGTCPTFSTFSFCSQTIIKYNSCSPTNGDLGATANIAATMTYPLPYYAKPTCHPLVSTAIAQTSLQFECSYTGMNLVTWYPESSTCGTKSQQTSSYTEMSPMAGGGLCLPDPSGGIGVALSCAQSSSPYIVSFSFYLQDVMPNTCATDVTAASGLGPDVCGCTHGLKTLASGALPTSNTVGPPYKASSPPTSIPGSSTKFSYITNTAPSPTFIAGRPTSPTPTPLPTIFDGTGDNSFGKTDQTTFFRNYIGSYGSGVITSGSGAIGANSPLPSPTPTPVYFAAAPTTPTPPLSFVNSVTFTAAGATAIDGTGAFPASIYEPVAGNAASDGVPPAVCSDGTLPPCTAPAVSINMYMYKQYKAGATTYYQCYDSTLSRKVAWDQYDAPTPAPNAAYPTTMDADTLGNYCFCTDPGYKSQPFTTGFKAVTRTFTASSTSGIDATSGNKRPWSLDGTHPLDTVATPKVSSSFARVTPVPATYPTEEYVNYRVKHDYYAGGYLGTQASPNSVPAPTWTPSCSPTALPAASPTPTACSATLSADNLLLDWSFTPADMTGPTPVTRTWSDATTALITGTASDPVTVTVAAGACYSDEFSLGDVSVFTTCTSVKSCHIKFYKDSPFCTGEVAKEIYITDFDGTAHTIIAPQVIPEPKDTNVNVRNGVYVQSMDNVNQVFTTGSNTLNVKVALKKPTEAEYSSPLTFTVTKIEQATAGSNTGNGYMSRCRGYPSATRSDDSDDAGLADSDIYGIAFGCFLAGIILACVVASLVVKVSVSTTGSAGASAEAGGDAHANAGKV